MRIVWGSKLETGVRTIDRQHEELVAMLNELHDAAAEACPSEVLDDVLLRLNGYIAFHFGTEEALMAELPRGDEHVEAHLRQHRVFVEQIANLRRNATGEDQQQAMVELADYLSSWLYQHIQVTDQQLAALLKARPGGR